MTPFEYLNINIKILDFIKSKSVCKKLKFLSKISTSMKSGMLIIFGIIDRLSLLEKLKIDNKKTSLFYTWYI